jgi:hypothetical protein
VPRRLTDLIRGLLAVAVILALLVGVPLALVVFVGEPFSGLRQAITGDLLSDDSRVSLLLRNGFAVIVGLAWAQLALALVVEMIAAARGRLASPVPVMPGIQLLARKLVVTALLVANAFSAAPAAVQGLLPLALPPPPEHVELTQLDPALGLGPDVALPGQWVRNGLGAQHATRPTYSTSAGDTFWSVAETTLGDGLRWGEIREANLGRTMTDGTTITPTTEVVRPGWDLTLPEDAVLATRHVERGDNFWRMAEETLTATYGRPVSDGEIRPYWQALIEANRDRLVTGDANLIFPGQEFELPSVPGVTGAGTAQLDPAPEVLGRIEEAPEVLGRIGTADGSAPSAGDHQSAWTVVQPPQDPRDPTPLAPVAGPGGSGVISDGEAYGLFGMATGAGALLTLLRRRRRLQAVRRSPGAVVGPVPAPAARFEWRIRSVADCEAVRWLEATNRFLTAVVAEVPDGPLPSVLAMRAGEFGVEVLLDEACPPPRGFVDGDGSAGAAWRLHPDLVIETVEAGGSTAEPYSPALVPVGRTDAGDLLVDLEQLAVVSVDGDPATVTAWMTTLAAALLAMPWSQRSTVVSIGVDPLLESIPAVCSPADPAGWAEQTMTDLRALGERIGASPYQQRVADGEVTHPTVVLLGPGNAALAQRLAEVANLVNVPLALVVAGGELPGCPLVTLSPDHGAVVPEAGGLRLEFIPVVTDPSAASTAAYLLAQAARPANAPGDLLDDVPDTVRRRALAVGPGDADLASEHWPPPPLARRDREEQGLPPNAPGSIGPDLVPGDDRGDPSLASSLAAQATIAPVPVQPVPVEPIGMARSQILDPKPVEARVLTGWPRISGNGQLEELEGTAEAVAVYLATVGSAPVAEVAVVLGLGPQELPAIDEQLRPVVAALGRAPDGSARLRFDAGAAVYVVSDEVGSDWRRALDLIQLARRATAPAEEMACLEAAVGLIEGCPGAEAPDRPYAWLRHDSEIYGRIETVLVDAAHRLGELALNRGRPRRAAWAATRGLLVVPGQEALHRIQMKAAALLHDAQGVELAYRAADRTIQNLTSGERVQPETAELYHRLTTAT